MEIINKKIKDLIPASYNPREITDDEFAKLRASIKEFGFVEPAVINPKNIIIGGHMRIKAAEAEGFTEVPCNVVDLSEKKEKLLNLALNKISGRWDTDKLGVLITELMTAGENMDLSGFEKWELDLYNAGPSDEDMNGAEDFQGEMPGTSATLFVTFDSQAKADMVSKFFNLGKVKKAVDGADVIDFLESYKKLGGKPKSDEE